ncbi:hypothetical protein UP10_14500 [Bradyrhizobium sp. LTSPM299]|nr:hypothetical protein UP10_14500 [Bradyrhizobium sp. LTSPM299]
MQSALEAKTQAEAKVRALGEQRAVKLLEIDGVEEIAALDKQIAAAAAAVGIHADRITAFRGEVRRQQQQAADRDSAERVAATETALCERDATAVKLETAIVDMGRLYFELIDQNLAISRMWRMSAAALRTGLLGEALIARETSQAMFAAGRPRNGVSRLPAPGNVGLGITGDTNTGTLAERIATASSDLLEMIRGVPSTLPDDEAA